MIYDDFFIKNIGKIIGFRNENRDVGDCSYFEFGFCTNRGLPLGVYVYSVRENNIIKSQIGILSMWRCDFLDRRGWSGTAKTNGCRGPAFSF